MACWPPGASHGISVASGNDRGDDSYMHPLMQCRCTHLCDMGAWCFANTETLGHDTVSCRIYTDDDVRPAPVDKCKSVARWFQDGYDIEEGDCNGLGLSIWLWSERAMHRGSPLFNPAQTTLQALATVFCRLCSDQAFCLLVLSA